jgi:hypothetical protein
MMKMQHVQGILVPRTPSAVTPETRSQIRQGVHRSHLFLTIKDTLWDKGILEINSYTAAEGGRNAVLGFLNRLCTLINTEGVAELRLKGALMITLDSDVEPIVIRAIVKDGEISYEQAKLTWDEESANKLSIDPTSTSGALQGR